MDNEENQGFGLDCLVDQVLQDNPEAADWTSSAKAISTQIVGGIGADAFTTHDPLVRLSHSELGLRALHMHDPAQALVNVGMFAANLLHGAIERGRAAALFGRSIPSDARRMVVFHGEDALRRSILVLDPTLAPNTPATVAPSEWIGHLISDAHALLDPTSDTAGLPVSRASDALEALWIARPRVVLAPAPPLIDTCVKRPAGAVVCGEKSSTCGAFASAADGSVGVTVCWHGSGPVGVDLSIDGVARKVTKASETLDTCFVALPEAAIPLEQLTLGRGGVLRNRAPGAQERHTFWSRGLAKEARIVAADFGVPTATPQRQLCVYTNAVTNYGDSGGALINEDDKLVGFCFQRTPFGAPVDFATWVWAASAFLELDLLDLQPS